VKLARQGHICLRRGCRTIEMVFPGGNMPSFSCAPQVKAPLTFVSVNFSHARNFESDPVLRALSPPPPLIVSRSLTPINEGPLTRACETLSTPCGRICLTHGEPMPFNPLITTSCPLEPTIFNMDLCFFFRKRQTDHPPCLPSKKFAESFGLPPPDLPNDLAAFVFFLSLHF